MNNNSLYIIKHISITSRLVIEDGNVIMQQTADTEFKTFSRELYKSLNCDYSKFYKMDSLCKLAFLAGELLMKYSNNHSRPENTALLLASSGSTIDTDSKFVHTLDKIPSPAIFVYTLPNIAAGELSIRHGWKGDNLFLISDAFNSQEMFENLKMLFEDSNTETCVTGWIDFLSDTDYKASLWLVTNENDRNYKELTANELSQNFKRS